MLTTITSLNRKFKSLTDILKSSIKSTITTLNKVKEITTSIAIKLREIVTSI